MRINLNETVRVGLTPEGEKIFREHCKKLYAIVREGHFDNPYAKTLNAHVDEYIKSQLENSEFQLWELFQIFGEEMYLGNQPVFVGNEIIFTTPEVAQ